MAVAVQGKMALMALMAAARMRCFCLNLRSACARRRFMSILRVGDRGADPVLPDREVATLEVVAGAITE